MKKLIQGLLGQFGYQLVRKRGGARRAAGPVAPPAGLSSTDALFAETIAALGRRRAKGLAPATIVDVGAAAGWWTQAVRGHVFPDSHYMMIEPLEERRPPLLQMATQFPKVHYVQAGAGAAQGTVDFVVSEDLDGSGVYEQATDAQTRTIRITAIDDEVAAKKLNGPFLIKLDTHGYEVPILAGARRTLQQTELVIIECYGFHLTSQSLLFWEMCGHMQELGFRLVDIIDVMRREKDYAFWQCDALFMPVNAPLFESNSYA